MLLVCFPFFFLHSEDLRVVEPTGDGAPLRLRVPEVHGQRVVIRLQAPHALMAPGELPLELPVGRRRLLVQPVATEASKSSRSLAARALASPQFSALAIAFTSLSIHWSVRSSLPSEGT